MTEQCEIRIRTLGGNKYAAEFWVDNLIVYSEANFEVRAKEIAVERPNDKERIESVQRRYANARKAIADGEDERYYEKVALLYTQQQDGSVVFNNPFQAVIDFK